MFSNHNDGVFADQEIHHQKHSFQDEFMAFLKKNNVAYDPRYIWD